jgi:hypothetical protein
MAFVAVAATVGGVVGLSGTAAIIGGGALIGAGVGGAYSALTGDGNILNSMLTGGLIGGAGAFGLNAMGVGAGTTAAGKGLTATAPLTGTGAAGSAASTVNTPVAALSTAKGTMGAAAYSPSAAAAQQAALGFGTTASGAAPAASTYGTLAGATAPVGVGAPISSTYGSLVGPSAGLSNLSPTPSALTGMEKLGLGLGATTLLSAIGSQNQSKLPVPGTQGDIRPYTYSSTPNPSGAAYPSPYMGPARYDMAGNPIMDTRERDYFTQSFTAGAPYKAANGGLMATYQSGGPVERMSQMNTAINPQGGMYPQGMIDKTQYALPTQRPTSMEVLQAMPQRMYAAGGDIQGYNLGGYSDGGRLLKGPGDGISDDIPAVIGDRQPARLADGEFVIPARIVSELGNGSTDAGAKRLYAMMDRIQTERKKTVGKDKIAKDSKARKHLPA